MFFFKAFRFPSAHLRYQAPLSRITISISDTPKSNAGSRQNSKAPPSHLVPFMISSCVAPPHCAGRLPRSSRLPFLLLQLHLLKQMFFVFLLGHRGCIRICLLFFFCPRFKSSRAFFITYGGHTTGNGVYLLNRSLMDGDGGVAGVFYIAILFLDFDVLFGARYGVKTHSLVFDFLLWSGLLLLVIFFLRIFFLLDLFWLS